MITDTPAHPLLPGDVVQLAPRTDKAATTLKIMGSAWIVQRIHPCVWAIKCQPGVLVKATGSNFRRWIAFPNDPNFAIIGKLSN